MAERTKIEWCDSTFNPWTGCTGISPGCARCYAEAWSKRAGDKVGKWGPGAPRVRTTPANWAKPVKWNRAQFWQCTCGWRGESTIGECGACGRHATMTRARRRVFCASLADVFDNAVDREWRDDLATLILNTPNLDWLLLTKRVGNAGAMLGEMFLDGPPDNVWLGATIVNQEEADRDIPKLLTTPAAVRFLSIEPLLGAVDLTDLVIRDRVGEQHYSALECDVDPQDDGDWNGATVDWVIAGGESGHNARPMHPDWVSALRDQCEAAGAAFLFKQWGNWMPISQMGDGDGPGCSDDPALKRVARMVLQRDGSDQGPYAFPAGAMTMFNVGKHASGRRLEGVEHNGFPRGAA